MTSFKFFHWLLLIRYCLEKFISLMNVLLRNFRNFLSNKRTGRCYKCVHTHVLNYKSILTWYKSTEVNEDVKIRMSHPVSVQLVPFVLTVYRQLSSSL